MAPRLGRSEMLPEPIQVTLKVVNAFEHLGIPYLIGGSFASAIHGVVRATMGADLVADIQPSQVSAIVALLEKEFYINGDMILDAIRNTSSFNMIHLETMFKVDIFILKQRPFDLTRCSAEFLNLWNLGTLDTFIHARCCHAFCEIGPDEQAYFCTAEGIILAKLEWYRSGW